MICFIMKGEFTPSADQKKAYLLNNVRKLLNGGTTRQTTNFLDKQRCVRTVRHVEERVGRWSKIPYAY
jgi:hypothetical protein